MGLSVAGKLPEGSTAGPELLLVPMVLSLAAFLVAWLPAAVAAIYVATRVGISGRMSWVETVILAVICLGFVPGVVGDFSRNDFWLSGWRSILVFLPSLLLAALLLRYVAGRSGLVR
jgi:hypothetical protein